MAQWSQNLSLWDEMAMFSLLVTLAVRVQSVDVSCMLIVSLAVLLLLVTLAVSRQAIHMFTLGLFIFSSSTGKPHPVARLSSKPRQPQPVARLSSHTNKKAG